MIKILVIKPSSLGDIIHAAGAVDRIARAAPDAHLAWVANEQYAAFVRGFPGVDEVVPFPRQRFVAGRFPRFLFEAAVWSRQLRGFDVAVDLQGLQRSGLMARVSGARERFGPQDARELARLHYNQPIEIPPAIRHAAGRLEYMADAVVEKSAILATAGRAGGTTDVPFRLPVPPPARSEARRLVGDAERLVALCPGTRWRSKRWPVSRWARLVHELATELPDVQVALLGAESESSLVREILSEAGADEGGRLPRDLTGQGGLWTAAAILELAECAVAMDSAQLHLAAAVGTPTVSLFGPTDPARFAPRGPEHQVLQKDELLCLGCHRRECPLERRACLPDLEAGPVLEAVRRTLGGRA